VAAQLLAPIAGQDWPGEQGAVFEGAEIVQMVGPVGIAQRTAGIVPIESFNGKQQGNVSRFDCDICNIPLSIAAP
jgi:hypothetical protein